MSNGCRPQDGLSIACTKQLPPDLHVEEVSEGFLRISNSSNDDHQLREDDDGASSPAYPERRLEPAEPFDATHELEDLRDAVGLARVQTEYQRERYRRSCQVTSRSCRSLVAVAEATESVAGPLADARTLFLNDAQSFEREQDALQDQEAKLSELEGKLFERVLDILGGIARPRHRHAPQAVARDATGETSELVEMYIDREGDRSVLWEQVQEALRGAAGRRASFDTVVRISALEEALVEASSQAKMLKAMCVAEGIDTRSARRRRRSTISSS